MIRYWVPFILYAAIILFVSTRPSSQLPPLPVDDKVLHFTEYCLFGALAIRVVLRRLQFQWLRSAAIAWCGVAFFALLDENVQRLASGRQTDPWDWAADVLGGLVGIGVYLTMRYCITRLRPVRP